MRARLAPSSTGIAEKIVSLSGGEGDDDVSDARLHDPPACGGGEG
jgi:hypothetical protein